jgi:cytochrome c peroxidase
LSYQHQYSAPHRVSHRVFLLLSILLLVAACGGGGGGSSDDAAIENAPVLPDEIFSYVVDLPTHFLVPARPGSYYQQAVINHDNTPVSNLTTNEGATLGRVLFYDTNLSVDRTVSCATCHEQALGFSDANTVSEGVNGGATRRHSMGLSNARFIIGGRAFWDERADSLEAQALMPIQDPLEMGLSLDKLERRLARLDYYPELFEAAFGDPEITSTRVGAALAQFVRSLISIDSTYDQGRAQVENFEQLFPNFTTEQNRGKEIFLTPIQDGGGACISCHSTEAFTNTIAGPTNNGLDADTADDEGVCEPLGFSPDELCGTFRVPSLRNVGVRPPYMHDGRFATLEEVVDHYSANIKPHRNLNPVLLDKQTGEPVRLAFSNADKQALVEFLRTLTDPKMLSDEKFSDPF